MRAMVSLRCEALGYEMCDADMDACARGFAARAFDCSDQYGDADVAAACVVLERAVARLERRCGDLLAIAASLVSIPFDKDDALAAVWVAEAANVRAKSFGIPSSYLCGNES